MAQSIAACRPGGHISLIGVLTGVSGEVPTAALFSRNITVSGNHGRIAPGCRKT